MRASSPCCADDWGSSREMSEPTSTPSRWLVTTRPAPSSSSPSPAQRYDCCRLAIEGRSSATLRLRRCCPRRGEARPSLAQLPPLRRTSRPGPSRSHLEYVTAGKYKESQLAAARSDERRRGERGRERRTGLQDGKLEQPLPDAPQPNLLFAVLIDDPVPLGPARPPVLDDGPRDLGPPAQVHPEPVEERRRLSKRDEARDDEGREVVRDEEEEADGVHDDAEDASDRGERRVEPGGGGARRRADAEEDDEVEQTSAYRPCAGGNGAQDERRARACRGGEEGRALPRRGGRQRCTP